MSILFYSKSCPNCLDFLKTLKEENMLKLFDEYFCVDKRTNLPQFLHSIPTIIVGDSNKPLVGDDAFAWLTYKLNQKYKKAELGTIDNGGGNFVDLTKDPNDLVLDSDQYISINNIDKPLKPDMTTTSKYNNAETMDVQKRMEMIQQERSQFMSNQQGPPPQTPNFQR